MRSPQKSNRSRGRGNRKPTSGGTNINRVYDSTGPEGKVRGTPQQIIDKYLSLARDAQTSGDRVASENFLQHAEHYQRILILAAAAQEQTRRENEPSQGNERDAAPDRDGPSDSDTQPDRDTWTSREPASDEGAAQRQPPAPRRAPAPAPAIEAMAMIDAGDSTGDNGLIVDEVEAPKPASRRSGSGRSRQRRTQEPTPAPADDAVPAPAKDVKKDMADSTTKDTATAAEG